MILNKYLGRDWNLMNVRLCLGNIWGNLGINYRRRTFYISYITLVYNQILNT